MSSDKKPVGAYVVPGAKQKYYAASRNLDEKSIKVLLQRVAEQNKPRSSESIPEPDPEIPLDIQRDRYLLARLGQQNEEAKDTHELRKLFSRRLYYMMYFWLVALIGVLCASGIGTATLSVPCPRIGWVTLPLHFHLSDKVLITLITATTANVVGVFVVVAKWLFPRLPK